MLTALFFRLGIPVERVNVFRFEQRVKKFRGHFHLRRAVDIRCYLVRRKHQCQSDRFGFETVDEKHSEVLRLRLRAPRDPLAHVFQRRRQCRAFADLVAQLRLEAALQLTAAFVAQDFQRCVRIGKQIADGDELVVGKVQDEARREGIRVRTACIAAAVDENADEVVGASRYVERDIELILRGVGAPLSALRRKKIFSAP